MSIESARQLIVKLGTDEAFRGEINEAAPTERVALLASYGFADVTRADLAAAKTIGIGSLSDADLQSVAGGTWYDPILDLINIILY